MGAKFWNFKQFLWCQACTATVSCNKIYLHTLQLKPICNKNNSTRFSCCLLKKCSYIWFTFTINGAIINIYTISFVLIANFLRHHNCTYKSVQYLCCKIMQRTSFWEMWHSERQKCATISQNKLYILFKSKCW